VSSETDRANEEVIPWEGVAIGALEDYFDFVVNYAPYFYWLTDSEQHDPELSCDISRGSKPFSSSLSTALFIILVSFE